MGMGHGNEATSCICHNNMVKMVIFLHIMAMTIMVFSLGFFLSYMYMYVCVLYSIQIFDFIYPVERLGSAVGQISPAAVQATAEWANRPGIGS